MLTGLRVLAIDEPSGPHQHGRRRHRHSGDYKLFRSRPICGPAAAALRTGLRSQRRTPALIEELLVTAKELSMGVQPAGRRRFRTRSLAVAVAARVSLSLAIVGLQPASASSAGAQSDLRVDRAGSVVAAPPR